MQNTKEQIIQNIKDFGQSLIDNAEKIANDYKYLKDLTITCYVNKHDEAPYISINSDFIPEKYLERLFE